MTATATQPTFGQFLKLVKDNDTDAMIKAYGRGVVRKAALNEIIGPAGQGGYLMPSGLSHELMTGAAERSIFTNRGALVVPMTAPSHLLPLPDATTPSGTAGVPSWFGSIAMTWQTEATTGNETEPSLQDVELHANFLVGYAIASNPMIDDAGAAGDVALKRLFSDSIAWFRDYAYLNGTGVGQPLGLLKSPGSAVVNRGTSNTFVQSDAANMLAQLLPSGWSNAVWLISPTVAAQLTTAGNWGTWVKGPRRDDDSVMTIFGRDALVTDKLPALGTKGDVVLTDCTRYVIGERGELEIAASRHVNLLKNQTAFRLIYRGDGRPWWSNVITLADSATTCSPSVVLN